MRVLVTGAEGYIGRRLVNVLQERGHDITGLDTGYYSDQTLYADPSTTVVLRKDIRRMTERDVTGFDAVVHLAELSNDPAGQFRPEVTYEINHLGTVALARLCKSARVSRFVYTSSCSVYGAGSDGARSEESAVDPQTPYARCKVLVESSLSAMADSISRPHSSVTQPLTGRARRCALTSS